MGYFEVAPQELRAVGADIKATGPGVHGVATGLTGVAGSVSDPPETAAALDEMGASWFAGLERLSDDLQTFGSLAQIAAHGYEVVDRHAMTVPGDDQGGAPAAPQVVGEDAPPATSLTGRSFGPFPGRP